MEGLAGHVLRALRDGELVGRQGLAPIARRVLETRLEPPEPVGVIARLVLAPLVDRHGVCGV